MKVIFLDVDGVLVDDEDHGVEQVRPNYFHNGLQDEHRDRAIELLGRK